MEKLVESINTEISEIIDKDSNNTITELLLNDSFKENNKLINDAEHISNDKNKQSSEINNIINLLNNPNIFTNVNHNKDIDIIKQFQNKIFSIVYQLLIQKNNTNDFDELISSYDPECTNDCFSTLDIDNHILNNVLNDKEIEQSILKTLISKLS